MSDGISVRGGADGIDAKFDDMESAARILARTADRIDGVVERCLVASVLTGDGTLLPFTDAPARHEAVRAAVRNTTALGADVRGLGRLLALAVQHYRDADDGVLHSVGAAFGTMWHAAAGVPTAVARGTAALVQHGPVDGLEQFLAADPALADALSALSPMFPISMLTGNPLSDLLTFLRAYCADGQPVVRATGADTTGVAGTPPRTLRDLMTALQQRDDGRPGEIDVRILGDGPRRHVIVDIPGTKDWAVAHESSDVAGLASNLRAINGTATAYEAGVLEAMRRAGVRADDDVLLVGHSLGGMVAVTTARDAVRSGAFRVTHVVTAGAPVGRYAGQLPRSVQLLALENRHDVVPHLDGRANPDRANITTVTFDGPSDSTGAAHGIDSAYAKGAALADGSDDPAITNFVRGASGFLDADSVRTERYVISRSYR